MTYSIVARDARTGELGVAVQSHWFSVGTVVTWAEAGVGAVATQAFAQPSYGPLGLVLMRSGHSAAGTLRALTTVDPGAGERQVAMVDARGGIATHTGERCIAAAGHANGDMVSAQANMMRNDSVWPAMLDAYNGATDLPLAERLLAALDAAEAAGGDIRGRQSSALLVVRAESTGMPWLDRTVDLRVDDSTDPLGELRRLLRLRRAYAQVEVAETAAMSGDADTALREYTAGRDLAPESDEIAFWQAIFLAGKGDEAAARNILADVSTREPGWTELVRRLPAAGLFPGDDALLERLLTS